MYLGDEKRKMCRSIRIRCQNGVLATGGAHFGILQKFEIRVFS